MAHKTRTAQVLDIVKVLAWVVIAVALVKFAFFPAVQEDEGSESAHLDDCYGGGRSMGAQHDDRQSEGSQTRSQ